MTRARVISGPPELRGRVEAAIRQALLKPRDAGKLTADVREMRERIAKEKGTDDIWDLKQVRGGLVDLEFIAQYLQLRYAAAHPKVLDQNTVEAFRKLLLHDLTQILRLCLEGRFEPATAPSGLKELLANAGDAPSFAELEERLRLTLIKVAGLFNQIIA